MPMAASEIEALIRAALPDAKIEIRDLAGDGDHYAATVIAESEALLGRVDRALGGRMGGELHALQLETAAPDGESQ